MICKMAIRWLIKVSYFQNVPKCPKQDLSWDDDTLSILNGYIPYNICFKILSMPLLDVPSNTWWKIIVEKFREYVYLSYLTTILCNIMYTSIISCSLLLCQHHVGPRIIVKWAWSNQNALSTSFLALSCLCLKQSLLVSWGCGKLLANRANSGQIS